jgi:hypothetical protein
MTLSYKDRTEEFVTIVESIRSRRETGDSFLKVSPSDVSLREVTQQKTEFALAAQRIGKDIYATMEKLEQLTKSKIQQKIITIIIIIIIIIIHYILLIDMSFY